MANGSNGVRPSTFVDVDVGLSDNFPASVQCDALTSDAGGHALAGPD